ncbi:hypothetical protein YX13_004897 [Salmonella enterica subsp. enterica serovar Urbana]|nr:hypothetical protein [Salmonella enterica subsp. enterica serovar Urbana]
MYFQAVVRAIDHVELTAKSGRPIQRKNIINILRHSRRFFRCACKALLPAAP